MRRLAIWVSPPYQSDKLFDASSSLNRDNCLKPFRLLRDRLNEQGWICHTQDFYFDRSEIPSDILYLDMPKDKTAWPGSKKHLLIQESEVVVPQNWHLTAHQQFNSIFTWSEDLYSSGGNYVETHFAQDLPPPIGLTPFASRKFCTLIAGNKSNRHKLELYSERISAIRFFESRSVNFDLFGMGWERLTHGGFFAKVINRLSPWLSQKLARPAKSYRGRVESKFDVLQNYKFAICFENAHSIPGYITEKLFDCLIAGCVPVYWGAPDIDKFVPAECYIDFRQCKSYDDLLRKLTNFSVADYEAFLSATISFLQSPAAKRFSNEAFAEAIAKRLGATSTDEVSSS